MQDRPPWRLDQILSILTQSLRGLASLHASPIPVIHRDIKPENILVEHRERLVQPREPGPWIKLADFGLATQGSKCEGAAGTWKYAAPEVFSGQAYDSKVDIWSLGVVILQLLLTGHIPNPTSGCVQGPQWCQDIITVAGENYRFCLRQDDLQLGNDGSSMKTTLWGFIALFMLKREPKDRKSAQQCLDSPILTGLQEYERLLAKGAPISARQSQDLYANPALEFASASAPLPYQKTSPAVYDQGVAEKEALKYQGSQISRTARTPQRLESENPQPLSYGLVSGNWHDNVPANQQQEAVEDSARRQSKNPETCEVAESEQTLRKLPRLPSVAGHSRRPSLSRTASEIPAGIRKSTRVKGKTADTKSKKDH